MSKKGTISDCIRLLFCYLCGFIDTRSGKAKFKNQWKKWRGKEVNDKEMRSYKFRVDDLIMESIITDRRTNTRWIKCRWKKSILRKKIPIEMKVKRYFKAEIKSQVDKGNHVVITWFPSWIRWRDVE